MSACRQAGTGFVPGASPEPGANPGPGPGGAAAEAAARAVLAPCGIDCRLCSAYQRKRKPCPGCGGPDAEKPAHCVKCAFVLCEERPAATPCGAGVPQGACAPCSTCAKYPCRRLKQLDKRYREKYHYSPLAALALAEEKGPAALMADNAHRFTCPACGKLLCLHRDACLHCGDPVEWAGR